METSQFNWEKTPPFFSVRQRCRSHSGNAVMIESPTNKLRPNKVGVWKLWFYDINPQLLSRAVGRWVRPEGKPSTANRSNWIYWSRTTTAKQCNHVLSSVLNVRKNRRTFLCTTSIFLRINKCTFQLGNQSCSWNIIWQPLIDLSINN